MGANIRKIEEMSMNAWPALQTVLFDGWVLRFANGYSKRANSVNPIYESTLDIHEKIINCEQVYHSKNLPTIFKITDGPVQVTYDELLSGRGYEKHDETSLRTLSLNKYNPIISDHLQDEGTFTAEWIKNYLTCADIHEVETVQTIQMMLSHIVSPKVCAILKMDDEVVACGYGVIENGYVGIFDIIVKESQRGHGYGQTLVEGILGLAKRKGAQTAYLQVMCRNKVADWLYEKLGFEEVYRYWYRVKA